MLGVNVLDASGYPDCRPEWLAAMQEVARLGTRAGVEGHPIRLWAPLIEMTKARDHPGRARRWASTTASPTPATTRRPDGAPAARATPACCAGKGFEEAGVPDPTRYG